MHYENVTYNLSGGVRRERVGGRDYLVAPVTLIAAGVLNGSQGPLLYPAAEIEASTPFWEGTIITDGHIGHGANGRLLHTQEKYAIGVIQRPVFNNNRLQAEAWFDVERTRRINPEILRALNAGQKIEVSTGLSTTGDEYVEGVHNGRPYNRIARNFRPDHLAILMTQRGACSLDDGCGVLNCGCEGPAGGSLGPAPSLFEAPAVSSPIVRRSFSSRGGPVGGSLGIPELNFDRQPTQSTASPVSPQRRDYPSGGMLGPTPTVF